MFWRWRQEGTMYFLNFICSEKKHNCSLWDSLTDIFQFSLSKKGVNYFFEMFFFLQIFFWNFFSLNYFFEMFFFPWMASCYMIGKSIMTTTSPKQATNSFKNSIEWSSRLGWRVIKQNPQGKLSKKNFLC